MKKLITLFKPDPKKSVEENTADFVADLEAKGVKFADRPQNESEYTGYDPDAESDKNILNAFKELETEKLNKKE